MKHSQSQQSFQPHQTVRPPTPTHMPAEGVFLPPMKISHETATGLTFALRCILNICITCITRYCKDATECTWKTNFQRKFPVPNFHLGEIGTRWCNWEYQELTVINSCHQVRVCDGGTVTYLGNARVSYRCNGK